MSGRRQGGGVMIEAVMFIPILILLLFGMVELARVSWTYYTLNKVLYTVARYVGTQQGVNFCDDADAIVEAAKQLALTGTTDGSGEAFLPSLTASQIQVRIERYSAQAAELGECECSITGCDTANGGQGPDYIVVSIPDGYPIQLNIPALPVDPIPLKPRVRVPFQGT